MPVVKANDVAEALRKGSSCRVSEDIPAKFQVGETVKVKNMHPIGHTRVPRYARGRQGTIDRDHGVFVFPDTNALGQGKQPQHVYSVRFCAQELWGSEASPQDHIYVDLWDNYLETAET